MSRPFTFMEERVEIFKQEKDLLFKLLAEYEAKDYVEQCSINSLTYKLRKTWYTYFYKDIDRLVEIEDKLSKTSITELCYCIEDIDKSDFFNYLLKENKGYTCILYSDDYWNGVIRLSNGEVLYIKEAIEVLKAENLPAFEKLKNSIKNKIKTTNGRL